MEIKSDNKSFTDSLVSDVSKLTGKWAILDEQIRQHIREKGSARLIEGIYGDSNIYCSAYIKETTIPTEGGTFHEFYGCKYKYQGGLDRETEAAIAPVKRAIIESVRLIYKHPLLILFLRKKEIIGWLEEIYQADLRNHRLPLREFSRAMRELIRVGLKLFPSKIIVYCFAMMFEFDNAYFQRLRDALCLFNKENIKKNVIKEINRVFGIFISRENDGLQWKYFMVKRLLFVYLLFSRKARNLIKDFILELDLSKIDFDEDDFYFCLNRRGYNFRGISFEERFKEYLLKSNE